VNTEPDTFSQLRLSIYLTKIKSKSRIKGDKMDTTHFPDLIIKNGGVNLVL
jgi:hypothetical protein